jgi:hypothetical protein
MIFELTLTNCFWLIIPLLVWNMIFGSKITQEQITSDANSPTWLLALENLFRLATFILPFAIPMQFESASWIAGLAIYLGGTFIYFSSWLPLIYKPQTKWSQSIPGLFAPRLTPFISLLGVSIIANSWFYGLIAAVFILFHTWHGVNNLKPRLS